MDDAPTPRPADNSALEDSAEAELLEAQADVLEAKAKLVTARQPLIDRIIMRGLIPIALAVVGPWALWTFNEDNIKTQRQVAGIETVVEDLTDLLAQAVAEREARVDAVQRAEIARATELHSLSTMVSRLRDAMRDMAIRQAVRDLVPPATPAPPDTEPGQPGGPAQPSTLPGPLDGADALAQMRVVDQAMQQLQDDDMEPDEVEDLRELVREAYEQRQEQVQMQAEWD